MSLKQDHRETMWYRCPVAILKELYDSARKRETTLMGSTRLPPPSPSFLWNPVSADYVRASPHILSP